MAQTVTLNGTSFSVPDPNDTGWGPQLTSYLVSIPGAVLQKNGGTFTLTNDIDFGASFGLKSLYFKSRSANIAASGVVRLANAESVVWRNAANSADLALSVDASNRLTFNGAIVVQANGIVPIAAGGTNSGTTLNNNRVMQSSGGAIVEAAAITASRALISDANGIPTHSATTSTELGYVSGVTSAIQTQINGLLPLTGGTLTGALTINPATNQLILGGVAAGRTVTITAPQPATSSRTWTIPDISSDGTFASREAAETFSGVKTFSANPTITQINHTGGVAIQGTNTNDSAPAGYVGETVIGTNAGVLQNLTNGQFVNLTSISLTAGHWVIYGVAGYSLNGATSSGPIQLAISTNSGNTTTDHVVGDNQSDAFPPSSSNGNNICIAGYEKKLTSTTTVYLKAFANFSAGTMQSRGRITAVRIR